MGAGRLVAVAHSVKMLNEPNLGVKTIAGRRIHYSEGSSILSDVMNTQYTSGKAKILKTACQ